MLHDYDLVSSFLPSWNNNRKNIFRPSLCSESLNSRGHEEVHKQDGQLPVACISEAKRHAWLGVERRRFPYFDRGCGKQCMRVEINYLKYQSWISWADFFLVLGHVTHFCLQRHFTGKHEGSFWSQRSIVVQSSCAQKVSFDGIPASARRDQVSLKTLSSRPRQWKPINFSPHFADGCRYGGSLCARRTGSTQRPWPCHGFATASSCVAWTTRSPSIRSGGRTPLSPQSHALPQVRPTVEGVLRITEVSKSRIYCQSLRYARIEASLLSKLIRQLSLKIPIAHRNHSCEMYAATHRSPTWPPPVTPWPTPRRRRKVCAKTTPYSFD